MPNPVNPPWSTLIPLIPVREHCVEVQAQNWRADMTSHGHLGHFNAIFGSNTSIRLSRDRLLSFSYPSQEQKCLEILMWGYPSSSRGQMRPSFLKNLALIAPASSTARPWPAYYNALNAIGTLGISTITKLAYFYQHKFNNLPALILDARLIAVLQNGSWTGATLPGIAYSNAPLRYLDYLTMMSNMAAVIGCQADQLEFVLFSLGDSFP